MKSADLDWLPADGACLTLMELRSVMISLRSLIDGTEPDEPNRAYAVTIADEVAAAIDREDT